ncbi:MAG TPA: hypothetical protein VF221_06515 [Chloroflexota bacterium]
MQPSDDETPNADLEKDSPPESAGPLTSDADVPEAIPAESDTPAEPEPEEPAGIDDLSEAVSTLEGELISASTRTEYDALMKQGQVLVQRISSAEGLGPQERAAVEYHVRDILKRARVDFDRDREICSGQLLNARERLTLLCESFEDAGSITDIQETRADLRLLRGEIESASAWAPRDDQMQTWQLWQSANQAAWQRLNELWKENEAILVTLLDGANAQLERGNPRAAKEMIKEFHAAGKARECSHEAMKGLRRRAQELWDTATEAAKAKHEAYVLVAHKRLDHLRTLLGRSSQVRQRIEGDVAHLQNQLTQAQTEVAAALIRGQIQERQKELRRVAEEAEGLAQRIADTERALT